MFQWELSEGNTIDCHAHHRSPLSGVAVCGDGGGQWSGEVGNQKIERRGDENETQVPRLLRATGAAVAARKGDGSAPPIGLEAGRA